MELSARNASEAIEKRTQHYRRRFTMRKRHVFRPAVDSLEARLALSAADVVQEGDFQGQFGDQTTPDAPGTPVPVETDADTGVAQAATVTAAAAPRHTQAATVTAQAKTNKPLIPTGSHVKPVTSPVPTMSSHRHLKHR
jgi:hypothetical protein